MFDVNVSGTNNKQIEPFFSLPTFEGESLEEARERLKRFKIVTRVADGFIAFNSQEDYNTWKHEASKKRYIEIDYGKVREMFEEDDELLDEFDTLFGDF